MTEQAAITAEFDAAVGAQAAVRPGAELLPSRLARAAATVLATDGASLSLLSKELRVPLGASSPAATRAERLQFTLGEGPCLDVLHGGAPTRSDGAALARTWPLFHRELVTTTPFRSVVAVPLPFDPVGGGGALDLYLVDPGDLARIDPAVCAQVADRVVERLVGAVAPTALAATDDASAVPWLQAGSARTRMEVWVAIGVLTSRLGLDAADGLALLRAWAHSHDTDVDRVAAELVGGGLDVELLRP